MWLVKYLKSLSSEHRSTVNILNSLKNCTATLPLYCFITLAKIKMGNARVSVSEILGVFVNTLTANDKYSFLNRKNLLEPIQLQMSKIQKSFSQFFAVYLKSTTDFEHFEKKRLP